MDSKALPGCTANPRHCLGCQPGSRAMKYYPASCAAAYRLASVATKQFTLYLSGSSPLTPGLHLREINFSGNCYHPRPPTAIPPPPPFYYLCHSPPCNAGLTQGVGWSQHRSQATRRLSDQRNRYRTWYRARHRDRGVLTRVTSTRIVTSWGWIHPRCDKAVNPLELLGGEWWELVRVVSILDHFPEHCPCCRILLLCCQLHP